MTFPSITFVDKQTVVPTPWLQAVNDHCAAGDSSAINNLTALRAQLISGPVSWFVLGYAAQGDGGGGLYYLDAADHTSSDNGGTIIVAADGGRWKLFLTDALSVKTFGAKCDGVTDDTSALISTNLWAKFYKLPMLIPGAMQINSLTSITVRIVDSYAQLFTATSNVRITSGQTLRPEWWGADPTNVADSSAAFNAFFTACLGREGQLSGMYRCDSPIIVDGNDVAGLVLKGIGFTLLASGGVAYNTCGFNFDGLAAASHALTIKKVRGLVLENFFISHNLGGNSLTRALHVHSLEGFRIEGVYIEAKNGASGSAFVFGDTGGADAAFMGELTNCKAYTQGGSFVVLTGCTSIKMQNCYQSGGYFAHTGCYYCTLDTCASEGAPLFAYILSSVVGFTATSCAGEANGRGVFYVQQGCSNVNLISPFGAANNTDAVAVLGDLVYIDGSAGTNSNISVSNPVSLNPHIATVNNIGVFGTNGYLEVTNTYSGTLSKGIGASSPAFLQNYLTVSGDFSTIAFLANIVGWVNVGSPSVTGKFTKRGSLVTYTVTIVPATSISGALNTAQLVLPWGAAFVTAIESTAAVVNATTNASLGLARMQTNGVIWMPTFGPTADTLIVSGTLILP